MSILGNIIRNNSNLDSNTLELIEPNIKLYIEYLQTFLKPIFNDKHFIINPYNTVNYVYDDNDNCFYSLEISSSELKSNTYNSIFYGPMKHIYNMEGVLDLRFGGQSNRINVIYSIDYFKQKDFFKTLTVITKFNL